MVQGTVQAAPEDRDRSLLGKMQASLGAIEVRRSVAMNNLFSRPHGHSNLKEEESTEEIFEGGLAYVVLVVIVAFIYKQCMHPEPVPEESMEEQVDKRSFEYGLFNTDKCTPQLFLCSLVCTGIVWADTLSSPKITLLAFWPALLIFTVLEGFMGIIYGLLWLVLVVCCIYYRQQIRGSYGLDRGGATCFQDCLAWTFCCCCAAAQEARQVEFVLHKK